MVKTVDNYIEKRFFRSRSHILRKALSKYVSEFNYSGSIPYIAGPFNPSDFELLKKNPDKALGIPNSQLNKSKNEINRLIS